MTRKTSQVFIVYMFLSLSLWLVFVNNRGVQSALDSFLPSIRFESEQYEAISRHVSVEPVDTDIYFKLDESHKQPNTKVSDNSESLSKNGSSRHTALKSGETTVDQTDIDEKDDKSSERSCTETESDASSFYSDLELIKLIGTGAISYGFKARYKNRTVVAKIATDKDLYWSDIEIDFLHELKRPPTISNIPKQYFSIRSMPNPFFSGNQTYLKQLGISSSDIKELITKRRISVIVMDYRKGDRDPKDLNELRRLMKSLLETMQFAHSRNIMHCDFHNYNYIWDGEKVSFFDWNAAYFYEPNKVPINYKMAPHHIFPPEAQKNTSAVHTSVYAFDVYTIGKVMKRLLKDCCEIRSETIQKNLSQLKASNRTLNKEDSDLQDEVVAYELADWMMTPDPYKRPDTTKALAHSFFHKVTQGGDERKPTVLTHSK
eukprot:jgi/Psemu1/32865/gm1.32865_g